MEFRVLGGVELRADGRILFARRPQQNAVLAALVVDAGRMVPVEELVDRVWGPQPPAQARRALHTHIAVIRRQLDLAGGAEDEVRLVRRTGGYQLEVDPDRVDVHRFRSLVEQARDRTRSDRQRAGMLREAVGLWRGEPLAGVPGEWAARVRVGWQQRYLDAVVAWAQTELRIGNPGVVIGPVVELIGQYPLVESLVAELMRALHAVGRPAEALGWYSTIRQRLVEDLGVDTSTELQELHRAILRGELDGPPAQTARAAWVVPAQLPADVYGFVGRTEQLTRLDRLLVGSAAEAPTAVVISAVSGTAGVGKTALAVHWAHRVADRFPDGQLYVNLRGFDPGGAPMTPADAVRGFLDAFAMPAQQIPASLDAQTTLYRSLLAGKRILVLLDNARDAEQARPLLPGAPNCLAMVTSRNQLTSLVAADGAHPLTLDVLPVVEARELLARRLGADRVAAEPDAVEQIISACAGLPLALSIAAARAQQTGFPLAGIAAELYTASQRLDALDAGDAASQVRAVFSWSYTALAPPAARLFRLLGMHSGPHTGAAAAASLAGLPAGHVRPLLAELARAHLLAEPAPGRFALHDLLRAYATELAQSLDTDIDRRAALHRMLDHYLHTAYAADRLLHPERDPIILPPPRAGATPEHLVSPGRALSWFATERPVLLRLVGQAASAGFDPHTWRLAWTVTDSLQRHGHWHDQVDIQRAALEAGRRLADQAVQAHAHRSLARAYLRLGRDSDAHTHIRDALDLVHELDDPASRAITHLTFGAVLEQLGRNREALIHARRALALFRAAGNRHGQANSLNSVGWLYALLLDHQQALSYCQQALALHEQLGNRIGAALTWDSLGYARHHLGRHREAMADYRHSLDLLRELGDRYNEAVVLSHLGDTHNAAGDPDAARDVWRQALAILEELDHRDADDVRTKLRSLQD